MAEVKVVFGNGKTTIEPENVETRDEETNHWEHKFNLVIPKLSAYLKLPDVLRCRLVSKKWLHHVDTFLSGENPFLRPYDKDLYSSSLHHRLPSKALQEECHFGKLMNRYRFRRSIELTSFTRKMVGQLKTNRNPFVGRYVSVGLINSNIEEDPKIFFRNVPEYWINVEKFLRHWGPNIWYLQLCDDGHTHTSVEYYIMLQVFLESVPNLKRLDIATLHLDATQAPMESLDETIAENPLPALPNLESILLPPSGRLPDQIQHILVRTYARQLKNLRFNLAKSAEDFPHVVTKLNELSVFGVTSNEKLTHVISLFTIPLAKLHLDLHDNPNIKAWSVERVMELVQDFPVKVLVLKLGNETPLRETQSSSVPIQDQYISETLQTLEMNHCPGTSYNFLWCLPTLKHLHLEYNPYVDGDLKGNLVKLLVGGGSDPQVREDQEVDIREFVEYGGDIYESNVWCVVPSLEVLTYTKLHWCWWPSRQVYRRDLYEWQRRQSRSARRRSRTRSRRRGKWELNQNRMIVGMPEEEMTVSNTSRKSINMRRLQLLYNHLLVNNDIGRKNCDL